MKIIKSLLRGRDIKRYGYEFAEKYIIATFPALHLNIDNYPAIKEYLQTFGKRLEQSGEKGSRKKTSNKWFEIQDQIAYWKEFEKEKIIQPQTVKYQSFCLDRCGFYGDVSMQFWTSKNNDLKYLLAMSNSKIFNYYMIYFNCGKNFFIYRSYIIFNYPCK